MGTLQAQEPTDSASTWENALGACARVADVSRCQQPTGGAFKQTHLA